MQISSRRTQTGSGLLIEINKPHHLNALDLEAFQKLEEVLRSAGTDPEVAFVALWAPTHLNPKAFCAGGDVRRLYEEFKRSGNLQYGASFFGAEYQVDQRIWNFPKPVLALTHGITMGGGLGLIRGAPVRWICETSVWAMPEISIGLYPDVGATYFLRKLPGAWAAFLALTGARIGPSDLLELGLATQCCRQGALPELVAEIDQIQLARGLPSQEVLESLMSCLRRFHQPLETRSWKQDWALIEPLFGPIVIANAPILTLAQDLWTAAQQTSIRPDCSADLRQALQTLLSGSPLSLCLTIQQLQQHLSLEQAFLWEYQASMNCLKNGDFFEGVRSRLVDKDFREPGKPQWKYGSPQEIPELALSRLLPASNSR